MSAPEKMAGLRTLSTDTEVTLTSFVNVYTYSDFRDTLLALVKT